LSHAVGRQAPGKSFLRPSRRPHPTTAAANSEGLTGVPLTVRDYQQLTVYDENVSGVTLARVEDLGEEINSATNDIGPRVSFDGRYLFFSSCILMRMPWFVLTKGRR